MNNTLEETLKRRPIVDDEFLELYEMLTFIPPHFDKKDPERIKIFAERLRQSREAVAERNAQIKYVYGHEIEGPRYCNVTTQKQVAEWLGITEARVSQYENGKIIEIPMKHLVAFYDMFDVTPHYLLGYTDSPDKNLAVRKGMLLTDDEGKYKTVEYPMKHPILSQKKAINILSILSWRKTDWFITLTRFLRADDQTLELGFKLFKGLLESSKSTELNSD